MLLLAFLFEDPLSSVLPIAGYFDEIVALGGALFYLIGWRRGKYSYIGIWIPLVLYSVVGSAGWLFNSDQPVQAFLGDWFLNMKFFFAIAFGIALSPCVKQDALLAVMSAIKIITILFLIAVVVQHCLYAFGLQTPDDIKNGVPAIRLFYSHSEYFAAAIISMLLVTICCFDKTRNGTAFVLLQSMLIFSTMRYKAIAVGLLCIVVFVVVVKRNSRFKAYHFLIICLAVMVIGWDYVSLNFFSDDVARAALMQTSFDIAFDYFPLGTGFGSYASYMSSVFYSDVYFDYGLSTIWGLSYDPTGSGFISDTFWPMVIGQSGFLGLFAYVLTLVIIVRRINALRPCSRLLYASALCGILYLLVQSTASAAFVGPNAIPIGFWIGMMVGSNHDYSQSEIKRGESGVLRVRNRGLKDGGDDGSIG